MRYATARILQDETKKRRFNTIIFPAAPEANGDLYIQTTTPDRLDKLAYMVPRNIRLRIPEKTNIQQVIIETNNDR
jgi:hypothetical protein